MAYDLAIDGAPTTVAAGTSILLKHPSIGGTDPIDTGFLRPGNERALVVSTRTTAREVAEKLAHYGVDTDRTAILDTLSIDRGYSRRRQQGVQYVSAPDDVAGIVEAVEAFLSERQSGGRLSFDSISELAYYAGEDAAASALAQLSELVAENDAVALFHVSPEVHENTVLERFERACNAVIELSADGQMRTQF
ncbi:ATPase involved in flagella biogenesis [Halodesulfurarchaeum formicicum]|uniref:ATPase involved in flagella biogenesis n=1 Tax=Halodesulfurarchaeum formicicum TaxID=1873524 RepID=A0A1D8S798_9EURY|nr:ATPase domain-containing protein [Halodesulfurarchaeum formicicum]AOW81231.1 ATPase involved in flagella biogenesis [Halodesulfurarchaeum formicicum]APE96574.1 ATPase involved in flagella biogenesis [Halodesulfurarchaeum formicicum]